MSLVESFERALDWLGAPKRLPGRLEMETQRGKRFELEVVSFAIRAPFGDAMLRIPVFIIVLPLGSSPVGGEPGRSDQHN